ncbi:thiol-disulfide oxidoreductase ResA [Thalassobacillus pellis]|uniref:thiol-disulfide oxidoreductase ResA n=1 Tax=Thalassobacillus pellis TaxID=748008 RepID=UPI00308445D1|nr:peroxiredoxin [Thalassobacillus pellis]
MDKTKKKRKRLIFRSAVLVLLLGLVAFAVIGNLSKDNAVVAEGEEAPNFQLKQFGTNGKTMSLEDLEGKGVMLNFWATYCKPCEAEMPYMQKLYPKYKDKGVEIVGVNLDATKMIVNKFIDEYDLTFPNLHDEGGQVMDLYNVGQIPSTYFINEDGVVVEKVVGPLTLEKLDSYLQQIQPKG